MVVGRASRGAISLTGLSKEEVSEDVCLRRNETNTCLSLRVKTISFLETRPIAFLHREDVEEDVGTKMELVLSEDSDVVVSALVMDDVELKGCISLREDLMHSLHIVKDEVVSWKRFKPRTKELPFDLLDLEMEVRKVRSDADTPTSFELDIDVGELERFLHSFLDGIVMAMGQLVIFEGYGTRLLFQVMGTNNLTPMELEEAIAHHCYRGRVNSNTRICITLPLKVQSGLQLHGARTRPNQEKTPTEIDIFTEDGEWFPVKKKILRPCIALTKHVRDAGKIRPSVHVDVPCLIFDKVLMFLELQAQGLEDQYEIDVNILESLLSAAEVLDNQALKDLCIRKLGDFKSRMRIYRWEELVFNNGNGGMWIVVDGMILDVKRWLPEHPGGQTIIPQQALNVDATTFFEVYHTSRESFMYLKHFYIGEIAEEDISLIPCEVSPSDHFIEQLREYTTFRISNRPEVMPFKSF